MAGEFLKRMAEQSQRRENKQDENEAGELLKRMAQRAKGQEEQPAESSILQRMAQRAQERADKQYGPYSYGGSKWAGGDNPLQQARNATVKNIVGTSDIPDEERKKRIEELEKERQTVFATVNNLRTGISRARTYGNTGGMETRLAESEKRLKELETELDGLRDIEWSQTPHSYADELERKIGAAKQNVAATQITTGGEAGGRALAQQMQADPEGWQQRVEQNKAASDELAALERELERIEYLNKYDGRSYTEAEDAGKWDNFKSQTGANYDASRIGIDANLAWNKYLSTPTEANRQYAEAITALEEDFRARNAAALDDEGVVASWISQDAAQYFPQFLDQAKYQAIGGLGGAVAGLAVGNPVGGAKIGASVGSGVYSFENVRGSVYRSLIAEGVDEETARAAALDESLVSALIEGGSTYLSWLTLGGGKALSAIGGAATTAAAKPGASAATKAVASVLGKKASNTLAQGTVAAVAKQGGKSLLRKGLETAGRFALEVGSEGLEEGAQQTVSIANKERALRGESGLGNLIGETWKTLGKVVRGEDAEAAAEIWDATLGGMKISLMFGGTSMATNMAITSALNTNTAANLGKENRDAMQVHIENGLNQNKDTSAYKIASKLSGKENVSDAELGRLVYANELAKREQAIEQYKDSETLDALIEEGKETGKVAKKIALELEKKRKAGKEVTTLDVERLIAANDVYIQAEERTAEAEIAPQENISREDVSEPIRGENVAPRSNLEAAAMEMAQEEMRRVQRAESLLNNPGYGEHGTSAFREIVEESGRDPGEVRTEFQTAYEAGRTGLPRNQITVLNPVQATAFNAGQQDLIADQARDKASQAKGVKVSSSAGFDSTGVPKDVTRAEIEVLDKLFKVVGVHGHMAGNQSYNAKLTGTTDVAIANDFQREVYDSEGNVVRTFTIVDHGVHEAGLHQAMKLAPVQMRAFINDFYNYLGKENVPTMGTLAQQKQDVYGAQNVSLTLDKAMEEVTANQVFATLYGSDVEQFSAAMDRVMNGKNEDAKQGARTFLDVLSDLWKKVKEIAAQLRGKGDVKTAREVEQTADAIKELRDKYEAALKAAVENAAKAEKNTAQQDGGMQFSLKNVNGKQVVWIEDSGLSNKQLMNHTAVAEYIARHIGEVYTIIESGQKVYIGEDLPGEYTHSKYTDSLRERSPQLLKAKNKATSDLGLLIETATNRKWEKTKHDQNKDAKYGMYRYSTSFAFPAKDRAGNVLNVHAYDAKLLIRNASDGKKYLYDIVDIKKNTASAIGLQQRETRLAAYKAASRGDASADTIAQQGGNVNSEAEEQFSLVEDAATLKFLNNQEHVKVYRAMQEIDGKLYPPMAALVKGENGKKQLVEDTKKGEWYQADERPDLIKLDKNGKPKFELNKGNGGMVPAAYNPYFHTSASPLNDQFSSAYDRPNIVVVEGYIPSSELTSGYKAQYAKDSVGETAWHAGPVASKLKGEKARRVFLSRWFKAERVVPVDEVARIVAKTLDGESVSVPWNVVTPSLRKALEAEGVAIDYKDVKMGNKVVTFESTQYSLKDSAGRELSEEQREFFKDSKVRDGNGNLKVMYQGGKGDFTVFDRKKSSYTNLYGRGFYFTDSESHAKQYGDARAFYLDIKNPVSTEEATITKSQMRKFLAAVAENEDDYSFENYGYGATVDSVLRAVYSGKSDFAMLYDVSQTAIGDMVAAVELFNEVNGTSYDGLILDTETVTFRSEQVKSVDNTEPTEDPDIRFSLKEPVEETKNLIALHNLTEDKLLKALNLGGFPMPSIAVTKTDIPHTNFGDITLVMDKSTIDPKASKKNTVYSADAWTPTFPQIEYEADSKVASRISDKYYELSRKYSNELVRPMYGYANYLSDELNRYGGVEGIIERHLDDPGMMQVYLADTGREPVEAIKKEVVNRLDDNKIERYDYFISKLGADVINELVTQGDETPAAARKRWMDKHGEELKAAYRGYIEDGGVDAETVDRVMEHTKPLDMLREVMGARNYLKTGPETVSVETDTTATNEAIRKAAGEGYEAWLRELFEGAVKDTGVYNNKELFTPSGNRRSFKQTHYPVTLENIAKAMAEQNDGNTRNVAGFYGVKSLRAGTAKRFASIKEMHEYKDRLKHLTQEEADAITDALSERMDAVMAKILETKNRGAHSNDFMAIDAVGNMLMEMSELKTKSIESISKVAKEWHYELNNGIVAEIRDLLFDVSEMPVNIFEAKPERAVRFDEVLAAVLPDNASAKLRDQLEQAGVNVLTYKAGDDTARAEVVNSVEGAQFSLKEQGDLMRENAKLKEVNQALQEQLQVTKFAKVDKKSLDRFTKQLLKDYSSTADVDGVQSSLDSLYTYLANGEDGQAPAWEQAYRMAYETAQSVLENASEINDELYQQYKGLRNRLRNTGIRLDRSYEHDMGGYENLEEFRRANFGRIKLSKDGIPVDTLYQELAATYPELFDESEYSHPGNQLAHIAEVLADLQPYEWNPYGRNMREAATWLANDIMERFFELPQAKPTFADKAERKLTEQAIKDAKKLENLRTKKNERIAQLIQEGREKVKTVQTKERAKRQEAVKEVKEHYKAKEKKMSESRKASVLRAKIERQTAELQRKLLRGTDKQHIPQELQGAVAELLASINLESSYTYDPETGSYRKNDEGLPTRRTEAFRAVREQYEAIAANNDIGMVLDPNLLGVPSEGIQSMLSAVIAMKDKRIMDMTVAELETVWDVLSSIAHSVTTAGKMLTKHKWETTEEVATAFKEDTASRRKKNSLTESHKMLDIETPYTFFSHFGEAGHDFYRMLRNAQDREQLMQNELTEAMADVASQEVRKKAEKETVEFTTQLGEKLVLSKAHIMEIYLLNKRPQAQGHLLRGGIVQPKAGKVAEGTEAIFLNELDIANITGKLSEKERSVADGLQKLTLLLAEWGNEASMTVYGYEKFKDPNYWTIRSSNIGINETVDAGPDRARAIANMGSAKAVTPQASNTLDIHGVFETFDRHASDMMCYSAWLAAMEDANRLFNYRFKDEDWNFTGDTIKGILNRVSGKGSDKYWLNLMTDIQNGLSMPADNATEQGVMKAIGNVKKASVSGNLRVVAQQPTAYLRAATVLDPDLMLAAAAMGTTVAPALSGWKKAVKYAPIAARKAAGGYEIASNPKQLAELLYQPESKLGKGKKIVQELPLAGAAVMDQVTWGVIWNACELQTARNNKSLKKGTEAFNNAVKELFTEVIDQTQVVDGVLQRSQAMRSGSNFMKQMTSFTGEPTQGANIVIRAYDQLRYETNPQRRSKAIKKLGRAVSVYTFTAVLNAFAQSLVDGLRDDEDEEYWKKVWAAFTGINGKEETWWDYGRNLVLASNVTNNLNPLTWLPVWKDALSVLQGYSVERMDAASMGDFFDSVNMTIKSASGEGKYTTGYAALKALTTGSKLLGSSSYNMLRDVESIVRTFQVETDNYMAQYETLKLMTKPEHNLSGFAAVLYDAYKNDQETYKAIYADLIEEGVDAEKLGSKMESVMKADQGVSKVEELEQRYLSPGEQIKYDNALKSVQGSSVWKSANEEQRDGLEGDLYDLITQNSDGKKLQEKISEAAAYGVSESEYLLWQLALDMNNVDGKGGYTNSEKAGAITSMTELSDFEKAYLWGTTTTSDEVFEAYNAGVSMDNYFSFKAGLSELKSGVDYKKGSTESRQTAIRKLLNNLGITGDDRSWLLNNVDK